MNPKCPEPKCLKYLRLRKLNVDLGIQPCPFCKGEKSKAYMLTTKKKGWRKCMNCRKDFFPIRRIGMSKYWICKDHPWQRFKVGAEVIMCKSKPKTERELYETAGAKKPFQAKNRPRQPNVQMPTRS